MKKNWGANQAGSQTGARGDNCPPPNCFFAPPPYRVGLSFRIFVYIHLLCEINVQYMLCIIVLNCSTVLNFSKFFKILYKNFQNCFICFSNFP